MWIIYKRDTIKILCFNSLKRCYRDIFFFKAATQRDSEDPSSNPGNDTTSCETLLGFIFKKNQILESLFLRKDVIKLNGRMLEALSKCYSLLEMFPKSPFLLIASVSQPVK